MTLPPRRILYAALAMVALAGAGVAVALALRDAPADSAGFDPALGERASYGAPALSQNSPLSGTSAPRTTTGAGPRAQDTPAGGAGNTPAPAASPAPASASPSRSGGDATAEQQRFLRDGPEAAVSNRRAMEDAVARVAAALSAQDAAALSAMAAPAGLAADAGRIEVLAASYPPILSWRMSPNVNVFSSATATAYTSYAVVTWKDAGIVSEHTVGVTLRIVGGTWHLTTRGETDPDLRFVRSVVP
ncbi:MAG: hypothetical protein ACYCXZ_04280 [Coriobacteriia bacterium]